MAVIKHKRDELETTINMIQSRLDVLESTNFTIRDCDSIFDGKVHLDKALKQLNVLIRTYTNLLKKDLQALRSVSAEINRLDTDIARGIESEAAVVAEAAATASKGK